ncbi:hypothetical protein S675_003253 [Salmonella enterica subsp. enterica]|nr:hypothetical protein [Salmonella enterica subsp. enterica]
MSFIRKTLGGLDTAYYIRHFIFGAAIATLFFFMINASKAGIDAKFLIMLSICTILYPYSRFVYEQIVNFIMGDNVFFGNAIFMLAIKFTTMALCWGLSIFIAPIGLVYLYFYHTKAEKNTNSE